MIRAWDMVKEQLFIAWVFLTEWVEQLLEDTKWLKVRLNLGDSFHYFLLGVVGVIALGVSN